MRNLNKELKKKSIDYESLKKYGFKFENDKYIYSTKIYNNQFEMQVCFSKDKNYSKLIDLASDEEYILVDLESSTGEFVGNVRLEYENKLKDILEKCTVKSVFNLKQTQDIIKYIKEKYNDELEFLWEKFDDNAIWRNKKNNKWYGILMTIPKSKLGINSEEIIEVIDLRYQKGETSKIVNNNGIYPGYHMNKNSWITIVLDNSLKTKEIYRLIDNSYNLSIGTKSGLEQTDLAKRVYEYLLTIPKGKVVTYKQVAEFLGNKGLARVVGNILHNNPDGDKYPCYKVVNSKGELAEAFVFGGKNIQKERLIKDGIIVEEDKVDLEKYQW